MLSLPLIVLLALSLTARAEVQDAQPDGGSVPAAENGQAQESLLAADGEPVAPGRIPAGTSEQARALWKRLAASSAGDALGEIDSFDLSFEIQVRQPGRFNEIKARFRYLEHPRGPFLDARFERDDRRSLRGPRGDFLVEDDRAEPMVGIAFEEDRRALDEYSVMGGHFLTLTQLKRVRLVSLESRTLAELQPAPLAAGLHPVEFQGGDPLVLPKASLAEQARGLEWLEIRSPDFRVYRTRLKPRPGGVQRALLGVDGKTNEVRMVMLSEEVRGAIVLETALLVLVSGYTELAPGARVPSSLEVREVDPTTSPWTFEHRRATTMYLRTGGTLNPEGLTPLSFVPK